MTGIIKQIKNKLYDIKQKKAEESKWKEGIRASAKKEAEAEVEVELREKYKQEEKDKLTKGKGKMFMDKLAKEFAGVGSKIGNKIEVDGYQKDKVEELMGSKSIGTLDTDSAIKRMLGKSDETPKVKEKIKWL